MFVFSIIGFLDALFNWSNIRKSARYCSALWADVGWIRVLSLRNEASREQPQEGAHIYIAVIVVNTPKAWRDRWIVSGPSELATRWGSAHSTFKPETGLHHEWIPDEGMMKFSLDYPLSWYTVTHVHSEQNFYWYHHTWAASEPLTNGTWYKLVISHCLSLLIWENF